MLIGNYLTMVLWEKRTNIDILLKLSDEYENNMLCVRKKAAEYLLWGKDNDDIESKKNLVRLLDFYEGISLFWSDGLIETKYIWHFFFGAMQPFYEHPHTKRLIYEERKKISKEAWKDLEKLYKELLKLEQKNTGEESILSEVEIKRRLERESKLVCN
ncbi:DUF4760 domain-containing protein [Persephonella sp.]